MVLSPIEYYKTHLTIINPLLPVKLTPKEIELLSYFMLLNGSISKDRFGTTGKRMVRDRMKISAASMSNYMKSLINKGFINDNEILNILYPDYTEQLYQFKLVKDLSKRLQLQAQIQNKKQNKKNKIKKQI